MTRPHDLKPAFPWEKRHILVQDRVWYVPDQFEDFNSFVFPGWSDPLFFHDQRPICIEYCSGNGDWIAEKAQSEPGYNWVAIEKKFERVRKIWSKIKNYALSNLLIVCGEGKRITEHYIPSKSVHAVYINFPDPWPKQRHAKHRIIQLPFIQEMHRILKTNGLLTMVTDDPNCSDWMVKIMLQAPKFQTTLPPPFYTTDNENYGFSYFANLWKKQGKEIRHHIFAARNNPL